VPAERFIPPARDAVELPLDELAFGLLRYMVDGAQVNRHNLTNLNAWTSHHDVGAYGDEFMHALAEAYDWLEHHGLVAVNPAGGGSDWGFITRRGRRLVEDANGLATLRAERRLDLALHARIAQRVRRQFILGEYELAVFAALREVEVRVRELSGAEHSDIGMKLMADAFKPGGSLHDPAMDKGEAEALMALFRGAIGTFKNPTSHRPVEYDDPTLASEIVLFADLLLRMLDRVQARLAS